MFKIKISFENWYSDRQTHIYQRMEDRGCSLNSAETTEVAAFEKIMSYRRIGILNAYEDHTV